MIITVGRELATNELRYYELCRDYEIVENRFVKAFRRRN